MDERPPNTASLEKLRYSTTKAYAAIDNGNWAKEILNISVDARINDVALEKQMSSVKKKGGEMLLSRIRLFSLLYGLILIY